MLGDTLRQNKVCTDGLVIDPTVFTTLAFVTLDAGGERSFSFARKPGADTRLRFEELDLSLIEQTKVFHFGTLSLTHEPSRSATHQAVAYAKQMGKLITFDPNLRPPLWEDLEDARREMLCGLSQADVVKLSEDEAVFLLGLSPEESAAHIRNHYGVKLVFVTCGAKGCWFENQLGRGHVNAPTGIFATDTTGAGDIFGGSAVWSLLQIGKGPEQLSEEELIGITRFSCAAATLSTQTPGGISSVPGLEDVRHLVATFYKGDLI
jgi:sugar/nucleoside kinase (ribokinase family)